MALYSTFFTWILSSSLTLWSFSQEPDASASLRFTGNAIAYYGTVSPDHADISVSIDNETVTMPSGSSSHVSSVQTQVGISVTMSWQWVSYVIIDSACRCLWCVIITACTGNVTIDYLAVVGRWTWERGAYHDNHEDTRFRLKTFRGSRLLCSLLRNSNACSKK